MRSDVHALSQSVWVAGILIGVIPLQVNLLLAQSSPGLRPQPPRESWSAPVTLKPAELASAVTEKKRWSGSLELGLNGSEGNSDNFNLHTGFNVDRQTATGLLEMDFDYAKVISSGVKIDHHALLDLEQSWFTEARFGCFVHFAFDYDEFKSFDSRISANAGADYRLIDAATTELVTRLGAGFSQEMGGLAEDLVPEAVLGLRIKRQFTARQKLEAQFEYLPDWSDFANFRLETDIGWEVLLDEARQLSLKFELNDRYDNTPIGRQPNDLTYAVLLLWKL